MKIQKQDGMKEGRKERRKEETRHFLLGFKNPALLGGKGSY
jgi:hypothetical protein